MFLNPSQCKIMILVAVCAEIQPTIGALSVLLHQLTFRLNFFYQLDSVYLLPEVGKGKGKFFQLPPP